MVGSKVWQNLEVRMMTRIQKKSLGVQWSRGVNKREWSLNWSLFLKKYKDWRYDDYTQSTQKRLTWKGTGKWRVSEIEENSHKVSVFRFVSRWAIWSVYVLMRRRRSKLWYRKHWAITSTELIILLAVVLNVAINMGLQKSLWYLVFIYNPKWDSWWYDSSIFIFLRNVHTVFHRGWATIHSHQQYTRVPFPPPPCQHLFLAFLMIVILTSEHLIHSRVIIFNNTVLYTSKLLRG